MPVELRFADYALGRSFHAAVRWLAPRTPDTGMHGHADYYEMLHVLSGRGRHQVAGTMQTLVAGDIALVRPGEHHALSSISTEGLEFVNVAFSAVAWRTYVDLVGLDILRAWEQAPLPPVFHVDGESAAAVRASFERALTVFHERPSMLDIVRLWTDVIAAAPVAANRIESAAERARPAWLSRACAAMRSEQNMRGGVARLAELSSVSPAHLARSVRRHYGRTPTELVTEMRLTHAATLLGTTTEPITTIAHRCGFSSQSYFSRCFAAAEGCSPRQFRERASGVFVP